MTTLIPEKLTFKSKIFNENAQNNPNKTTLHYLLTLLNNMTHKNPNIFTYNCRDVSSGYQIEHFFLLKIFRILAAEFFVIFLGSDTLKCFLLQEIHIEIISPQRNLIHLLSLIQYMLV